jgi:hypothetical protein
MTEPSIGEIENLPLAVLFKYYSVLVRFFSVPFMYHSVPVCFSPSNLKMGEITETQ